MTEREEMVLTQALIDAGPHSTERVLNGLARSRKELRPGVDTIDHDRLFLVVLDAHDAQTSYAPDPYIEG